MLEAFFKTVGNRPRQSFPALDAPQVIKSTEAVWRSSDSHLEFVPADHTLRLVQDRADIDISGPDFNFVRTIRVFDVRNAWQNDSGRDGECSRGALVLLGTYGTQGDFSWQLSSTSALPPAHTGLERWGDHCPSIYHRSVFVDWRDYEGNYGFEQVNY
ncbi:hypothetical protein [Aliiroseovarius subalbicans]